MAEAVEAPVGDRIRGRRKAPSEHADDDGSADARRRGGVGLVTGQPAAPRGPWGRCVRRRVA